MKENNNYTFPTHPSFLIQVKQPDSSPSYYHFPQNSAPFRELELFRSKIASYQDVRYGPYALFKKKTWVYKSIFIALAAFFLIFGMFILTKPLFWSFPLLTSEACLIIKYILTIICFGISFFIARVQTNMRPEREAVYHFIQFHKKQLTKKYQRKKFHLGVSSLFSLITNSPEGTQLQQTYRAMLDLLQDDKEEVFFLCDQIQRSPFLSYQSRELLYNQAILEFKQKLDQREFSA